MRGDLDLQGNLENLRISASDVANHDNCPRHLAVKTRPEARTGAWHRRFGSVDTFVPRWVQDLMLAALRDDEARDAARLPEWTRRQLDSRDVHHLLRVYLESAIDNVLEAHYELEADVGPLRQLMVDPAIGKPPRVLWMWGPLFGTEDGVREVRRIRIGSAHHHPSNDDMLWAQTAARIAADVRGGVSPTRIRVVEIGAGDASITVLFDDTPERARDLFNETTRDLVGNLGSLTIAHAGHECGSCKVAGVCDGLIDTTDALGQTEPGYETRSISPTHLQTYEGCPARWLLTHELNLPKTTESSEAQVRGLAVHQWLEQAHRRGVGCKVDDLPEPGQGLGLVAGLMTEEDYATAYPFLQHHVATCPLSADGVEFIAAEETIRGYDETADVITVAKPDLFFRVGDRAVIREFKTRAAVPVGGADEIYTSLLQVPFTLGMFSSGVAEAFGCDEVTVEVEVLTPEQSVLYAWDGEAPGLLEQARTDLAQAVERWHVDAEWPTRPGLHCGWCSVRQWCPDRDAYLSAPSPSSEDGGVRFDPDPDDDPPPF